MEKLSAHSLIRITGVANVQETNQVWSQDDDFAVHKPQLTITVNDRRNVFSFSSYSSPLIVALASVNN